MEFNTLSVVLTIVIGIILILFLWVIISNNKNIQSTNNVASSSLLQDNLDQVDDEKKQLLQTVKELQNRISAYKSQIEIQVYNEDIQKRFIESNFEWNHYLYAYFNRISMFHPVYKKIREFNDVCNRINENSSKKEFVAELRKALDQIDLSNQLEVQEYWSNLGCVLAQFIGKDELNDSKALHSMTVDIYESQTEYIKNIIECLNLLKDNFSRFEKIANRSALVQFIHDFWSGCKDAFAATVIDIITDNPIGDIIVQWAESKKLNDSDFVQLYIETMEAFIDEAPKLILKIDDMLSVVYIKYMHLKTAQDLQILSNIRECTTKGEQAENILNKWENKMNSIHVDLTVHERIKEFMNMAKNL